MSDFIQEMKNVLNIEWDTCDHLSRFEAWADLYYRRTGFLSPGKDDRERDTSSADNNARCAAWHSSGLAAFDAIMEVVRLQQRIAELEGEIETMENTKSGMP